MANWIYRVTANNIQEGNLKENIHVNSFHKIPILLLTAFVDGIIIIMPVVSTTIPMIAIVTTSKYKTTKIASVLFLDRFLHSFN